jgi:hypothetical protein
MNKETEKVVNIKDIKITIDNHCVYTYPCMHDVVITIDGVSNEFCLGGAKLYLLTKYLEHDKFNHFKVYYNDKEDHHDKNIREYIKDCENKRFLKIDNFKIVF